MSSQHNVSTLFAVAILAIFTGLGPWFGLGAAWVVAAVLALSPLEPASLAGPISISTRPALGILTPLGRALSILPAPYLYGGMPAFVIGAVTAAHARVAGYFS